MCLPPIPDERRYIRWSRYRTPPPERPDCWTMPRSLWPEIRPAGGWQKQLVQELNGRPFAVADRDRMLYHATAAIASNHLVALCAQVERLAEHLGLPFDLYGELMTASLDNARRIGPRAALTGPAARGDVDTVDGHRHVLGMLSATEADLYGVWAAEAARLGRLGFDGRDDST